jgi:hypothetical protein
MKTPIAPATEKRSAPTIQILIEHGRDVKFFPKLKVMPKRPAKALPEHPVARAQESEHSSAPLQAKSLARVRRFIPASINCKRTP